MPSTEALRSISLFEELPEEVLEVIAPTVYERRYRKGAVIFGEGEPGEAVYYLVSGRVRMYRLTEDGREQVLRIWAPGTLFALVVMLDRGSYPATAEAMEDVVVWVIRVDDLVRLLNRYPEVAGRIYHSVGSRLRDVQDRAHDLAARRAHGRVASLLLRMAEEQGEAVSGGTRVAVGVTHQDLGKLVGVSRETVTRALSDFRRERSIRIEQDAIVITDLAKLREWM